MVPFRASVPTWLAGCSTPCPLIEKGSSPASGVWYLLYYSMWYCTLGQLTGGLMNICCLPVMSRWRCPLRYLQDEPAVQTDSVKI